LFTAIDPPPNNEVFLFNFSGAGTVAASMNIYDGTIPAPITSGNQTGFKETARVDYQSDAPIEGTLFGFRFSPTGPTYYQIVTSIFPTNSGYVFPRDALFVTP